MISNAGISEVALILISCLVVFQYANWLHMQNLLRSCRYQRVFPRAPPTLPSLAPILGHTLSFMFDKKAFMRFAGSTFETLLPVRVKLLLGDIYVVRGADNISSLFRESTHSNSTELHAFYFHRLFNMSSKATVLYSNDDSGFTSKPHPQSCVKPNNRIDHITHQVLKDFLLSELSKELATKTSLIVKNNISTLSDLLGDGELQVEDLFDFVHIQMTRANIRAVYGELMFEIHPEFCEDFLIFSRNLSRLYVPFLKWVCYEGYAARKRLLSAIKKWLRMMSCPNSDQTLGIIRHEDAYWSREKVRKWQQQFRAMDNFDEDDVASLYLGIIWASNYNTPPAVFWMLLEIYRDPKLLSQLRASLQTNSTHHDPTSQGQTGLQPYPKAPPLLESIFAEVLRLTVHAYITRRFIHKSVVLGGKWIIPRNKICLASTEPAHHDAAVWNTKDGQWPLDKFWAARFLLLPNDDRSGPLNQAAKAKLLPDQQTVNIGQAGSPAIAGGPVQPLAVFSLNGLGASWIPFGGGPRACPGRKLARDQVLATVALFVGALDIDIVGQQQAWRMDQRSYGPGVQLPVGKIPARIKKTRATAINQG